MSAHDLEHEPIPGLPHELPPGERIVWQGRPEWKSLALSAFKLRWVAIYFALMVAVRVVFAIAEGQGRAGLLEVSAMVGLFGVGLGLLALMAWLSARATVYTITTRRVVMRIGVALSMTWNLPFKRLSSADLSQRSERDGDIVLTLAPPDRVRWLFLFPHVQPGRFFRARPALMGLAEPVRVAKLLEQAVREWAASQSVAITTSEVSAAAPAVVPVPAAVEVAPIHVASKLAGEAGR